MNLDKSHIRSMRFRALPVHPKFQNNVAAGVRTGQFAEGIGAKNAYLVLSEDAFIPLALKSNGSVLHGRALRVNLAITGSRFSTFDPKRTVFVGNIAPKVTDEDIMKAFEDIGTITAVRIIRDRKNAFVGKGFGFVCFATRDCVRSAIDLKNGFMLQKRAIRVTKALKEEQANKAVNITKPRAKTAVRVRKPSR